MKTLLFILSLSLMAISLSGQSLPHMFKVGTKWIFSHYNDPKDLVQIEASSEVVINNTKYIQLDCYNNNGSPKKEFNKVLVRYDSIQSTLYVLKNGKECIEYSITDSTTYHSVRREKDFTNQDTCISRIEDIPPKYLLEPEFSALYATWQSNSKNTCAIFSGGTFGDANNRYSYVPDYGYDEFYCVLNHETIFGSKAKQHVLKYLGNPSISTDCFYLYFNVNYRPDIDISNLSYTSISEIEEMEQPLISRENANSIRIQNKSLHIENIKVYNTVGQCVVNNSTLAPQASQNIDLMASGVYIFEFTFSDGRKYRTKVF